MLFFFWSRKTEAAGRFFFLEQKTEAAWLLCCVCVHVQKKNCSSRFLYSIKNPDLYSRFG